MKLDKRMDRLEDFIKRHHEEFLSVTPPEGHFERFCDRLPAAPAPRHRYRHLLRAVAAVAACVICLTGVIRLAIPYDHIPDTPPLTDSSIPDMQLKMVSAMDEYRTKIERVMTHIESLSVDSSSPVVADMLAESKHVLHESALFEQNELPVIPANESGLYAVVSHYSTTLESLNHILQIIETYNRI